jgi:hypothetical protein
VKVCHHIVPHGGVTRGNGITEQCYMTIQDQYDDYHKMFLLRLGSVGISCRPRDEVFAFCSQKTG